VFLSFFPKPKLFLISIILWMAFVTTIWFTVGDSLATALGFTLPDPEAPPNIDLGFFVTPDFLWFYLFSGVSLAIFAAGWFIFSPHPYQYWSILGSALILFTTYFSVQTSVAINNWRGPFFDTMQAALTEPGSVTQAQLYGFLVVFFKIAGVWIVVYVATNFFISHYVFRWRQAMNDYYMSRWSEVRRIEGASQRVQEDTMRFSSIMEGLGSSVVSALMTLIAFLPVLADLSVHVTELPLVGPIAQPLLWAAVVWSIFGTLLLAITGIRLPGLQFRNQRVEASYRKELVYGEDDPSRAGPITTQDLFRQVRTNYFRMYFHYAYFNFFRGFYIQADNVFAYVILVPTIAAGQLTWGLLQQILAAFNQVANSFQFLVNSWGTIIELLSIHKRLAAFEAAFEGRALDRIESEPTTQP
jgi:peptide/bleomycin uptake transporter